MSPPKKRWRAPTSFADMFFEVGSLVKDGEQLRYIVLSKWAQLNYEDNDHVWITRVWSWVHELDKIDIKTANRIAMDETYNHAVCNADSSIIRHRPTHDG